MITVLASQDITAFHVLGGILAVWAVVLTALGIARDDFPGKSGGQYVVMAISAVLVVATVAAAIGTAKSAPKNKEAAGKLNKSGPEGSRQPQKGGTSAPGTGAGAGQVPGGAAGQKPPAGGIVTTLLISADPSGQLRFDKSSLQASAGNVRITMNNPSPVPHNVSLQGGGVNLQGKTIGKGGSSQVQAKLKPGTYTFYCSVPGHREAGMRGTLTVK